jgi:small subunit ribosomal protein S6e
MKLVIGYKGKSYQIELEEDKTVSLMGKTIGGSFSGNDIGLPGYEFKITGGSDKQGVPIRINIHGSKRIKPILSPGIGFKGKYGERKRKSIRGMTISEDTAQLNVIITKKGPKPLEEMFKKEETKKEEVPKEEPKKEKPKEEKPKEEPKPKEKKEKEQNGT